MKKNFNKFLILWFGQLIASIGSGLSAFALGVYAFEISKSAFDSSMVMLLGFLPSVLLLIPSGVLADRHDRRLLMILGDSFSALGVLFILLMKLYSDLSLIHIYIGVVISSIFSSLMQPAYQATVTDLLDEEDYTKSSGMIQIASSSKFLLSPILAGFFLRTHGIEFILSIDIGTILITVLTTFAIRKNLPKKKMIADKNFFKNLSFAWKELKNNRGILNLVLIAGLLTFFMGILQTLSGPYILSFSNKESLGFSISISAVGMLVSSVLIGFGFLKKNFVNTMSIALFFAGVFMFLYGFTEVLYLVTLSGFLFFLNLPIINSCMDYLVRANVKNSYQGRIWSFIGFISQLGYVLAYPLAGILADLIFSPAFNNGGFLYNNLGKIIGTGPSRGIGFVIILGGFGLSITAFFIKNNKAVKNLELISTRGGSNES
ncbi:MAG: MFS transporter [Lagierella massiliensis]|nr:MFS transporter [Lagierella massiliensis]